MDISHFRIGNYIINEYGETIKLTAWKLNEYLNQQPISIKKITIKPVPLTDEMVIKSGLKKKSKNNGLYLKYFSKYSKWCLCSKTDDNIISYVVYVHQIQNIYQATRGVELEFDKSLVRRKPKHKKLNIEWRVIETKKLEPEIKHEEKIITKKPWYKRIF